MAYITVLKNSGVQNNQMLFEKHVLQIMRFNCEMNRALTDSVTMADFHYNTRFYPS